ncbi:hypothetical protein FRB90_011559, partial [Tulasnella sp. 427]
VCEANPRTIVVVQAGSATSMPYVDKAAAILQAWYSGNEVGSAIADIVFGRVNPSGKLPITIPRRIEDIGPAAFNIKSENGKIRYAEDLFVGYRHYTRSGVKPLFPFGFGLSYSSLTLSDCKVSDAQGHDASSFSVNVSVSLTNLNGSGSKSSEVVQVYVTLPSTSKLTHPSRQLKAFWKFKDVPVGQGSSVMFKLNKYAVSYWDDGQNNWVAEAGEYKVDVGTSSADLPFNMKFTLKKGFTWSGL